MLKNIEVLVGYYKPEYAPCLSIASKHAKASFLNLLIPAATEASHVTARIDHVERLKAARMRPDIYPISKEKTPILAKTRQLSGLFFVSRR